MLQLTTKQMDALRAGAATRFERGIRDFIALHLSDYVDDLAPPELALFTRQVIASARDFGFSIDADIMGFAIPCAIYGAWSWQDPIFADIYVGRLDWCPGGRRRTADGIAEALRRVLDLEFAQVFGVDLMIQLGEVFRDGWDRPWIAGIRRPESLPELCAAVFPARLNRLRPGDLDAHLRLSETVARRFDLQSEQAILFYQQVGLFLGARFGEDPLYPWAGVALAGGASELQRMRRLETALRAMIERATADG